MVVLKQYVQSRALQNNDATVHVMLNGVRMSPTLGIMSQYSGLIVAGVTLGMIV